MDILICDYKFVLNLYQSYDIQRALAYYGAIGQGPQKINIIIQSVAMLALVITRYAISLNIYDLIGLIILLIGLIVLGKFLVPAEQELSNIAGNGSIKEYELGTNESDNIIKYARVAGYCHIFMFFALIGITITNTIACNC